VTVDTGSRWVSTSETLFNFELDVMSRLSVEGEGRMANVRVDPSEPTESAFEMQIEPRVFNDARRFKDEVLAKRFSTTIETSMHDSDVMDMVRKFISRQDVPDLIGQKQMGLSQSGDEFVTPNGTIDGDGWTDEPEAVYVEQDSGAERSFQADPDENGEIDNEEVAEMIELFAGTRGPERFVPVIGWLYAAPFRPEITERAGSMNLLFVTGESGVGKTGTLAVGSRLFGMSEEPFSCTDTPFAQMKTLSASRSVPMWLDEYKTSEMADWQQSNLHELLRKAATGGIEKRGTPNQGENMYRLRAPVIVSGETSIRGSAEQRRAINVTFTNAPTQSNSEEYRRFKQLAGDATTDEDGNVLFPDAQYDLEDHAVEYYRYVAATSREEFEEEWFSAREYVSRKLAKWDVELDDMEVQGLQTVCFGFKMLRSFAEEVGANLAKLPDYDELDNALRYAADVDGDGRETHTDQFLLLVQRATAAGDLEEGMHWKIVKSGDPDEELRVNVTRAFDAVSKYVRDHDLSEDLLGSARDYKNRFREAEEQESYVTTTSQNTPPISRAVGIDTGRAKEELAEFDPSVFFASEDVPLDSELVGDDDSDGDGDGNGPTRIDDLDLDDGTGFVTVTGQVTEWDRGEDSPLELTGTLKDESGVVRVVSFGEFSTTHTVDEGDYVRLENAEIDDYDGTTQLYIKGRTTDIKSIQPGSGHTAPVETPDDQSSIGPGSQIGLPDEDDSAETVNESTSNTTGAPAEADACEAEQTGARADGGKVGEDTHSIDQTILQHAKDVETTAALAGRVTGKVECDDLATIKHRIETLQDRGDIILRDTDTGGDQNPIDVEEIYRHAVQRIVARTGSAVTEAAVRDCLREST